MSVPVLDPQIAEVLRKAAEADLPPVETLTPEENRANSLRTAKELFGPVDEMHAVEDRDAEGVPVRIYRPTETSEPQRALVYFHGGGFVVGSIDTHDGVTRALARRADCIVVSVDYRLAPEHPYPAALEDCWAASKWVMANAAELGIDGDRIGVGGDSAGGTLATIVARKGRDAGTPFAVQLLLYPMTTSRAEAPSYSLYSFGYGLTRDAMAWYWKQYIGDFDGGGDPDISPAALQDLRRMPRAIVITAEADILRDEAESYAQRLFLAGVETEGYQYDGMIHGFLRMAGVVDRSNQALGEIAQSLKPFLDKTWRDDYAVTLDPKEIMAGVSPEQPEPDKPE
jgi:acetyl esterase/lipase